LNTPALLKQQAGNYDLIYDEEKQVYIRLGRRFDPPHLQAAS
jgi:hypothetical protein